MSVELKRLINELGITEDRAVRLISGGGSLRVHKFDINPQDFLQRAEDDYEQGGSSALLNTITNAKRAIHCQIDQALLTLGYDLKRWNLPRKVELLVQLGFVAPRILKRVTDARNVLEHEYKLPTPDQAEEALDLAVLFIEATNRHLYLFEDDFVIGNFDERTDVFHCKNETYFRFYDQHPKHLIASGHRDITSDETFLKSVSIGAIKITPTDNIFKYIIRLVVAGDNETKTQRALSQFFTALV